MRKIKEVLRLHQARLSESQVTNIYALGTGTVRRSLERAEAAQVSWPLPRSWMTPRWRRNLSTAASATDRTAAPNRITLPFIRNCGSPM
jgi:hypothetical protein